MPASGSNDESNGRENANGNSHGNAPEGVHEVVVEAAPDRLGEPVDAAETAPRLSFAVVGVGASAGGLEAYSDFLRACRPDANIAYVLIQHLSPKHTSMMAELLQKHTAMPVAQVEDSLKVEPNHVYVIRPGYTVTIHDGRLHLGEVASEPMHRRPVDDFFKSLAEEQRERAIAVILSGTGSNGTLGCESIKAVGGFCIAQDPESAKFPSMPRSVIDSNLADSILQPAEMFEAILKYATHPYASRVGDAPESNARRERIALGEIIAVLRARTRHDFSVYKKPTLIRRVQRRMSLMQMDSMSDYIRALRQTPSEVVALGDDLMIHVTGFFRDPEVWVALREKVIRPMVAEKADNSTVRCWVTACSSGEEAYTIGILLLEAAEAAGKHFDIKIFATDTAERSLAQARAGIFPGGIESEIRPDRLARFFDRDEVFYRVKKELRELVVFAPQNVLQDPPFSRLDLCTCRNLLIYIEPETQQRILAMLHFGLREGGTLLLGNSETIAGAEDLFEPVDKQHRIYRRIGSTRHGQMDFPVPNVKLSRRALSQLTGGGGEERPRPLTRATIAQLATKTLLDFHTPAAVVVDRTGQIVHVHGDTDRFLRLPPGEPTRDLMLMAREELRAGVRSALQRAVSSGDTIHHRDGTLGEGADRVRIELTAAPLSGQAGQLYFLICFATLPDAKPTLTEAVDSGQAQELATELRRVRDELQSTIEELQTASEEMKASHEEVTSINEELQSSNEELETSKEELQSLNEELSTVNAQLQAKMEELERTSNDLGSLLTSTEIAVVFLDRNFRIRRFTPAMKKLTDLIPSDVGRPFADLARRFKDATLAGDARRVLEALVPAEATVKADDGRIYDRRILPYRTGEDRIEGVVVTFVDVTERRRAEETVRASEERQAFLLRLSDALQALTDPIAISFEAARILGEHLRVDRAFFCEVDADEDHIVIHRDFTTSGIASFVGRWKISEFGSYWAERYRAGRTLATANTANVQGAFPAAFDAAGFHACVGAPVKAGGKLVGILVIHSAAPREWTGFEIALVEAACARIWAAVEYGKTLRALRVSERKFRDLFDSMDQGYCIIEMLPDANGALADWRFHEANAAFEKNAGLADVTGRTIREMVPNIEPIWFDIYGRIARTGAPVRVVEHSAAMGRWFDLYAFRVDAPELLRVAILFTDVTERRRQEVALRKAERQHRALAANLPGAAVFVVDLDLRYRLAEGEALQAAGFTPADFEGKIVGSVTPQGFAAIHEPLLRRALQEKQPFRHEHTARGRWYITHGTPICEDEGNEASGLLAVSYDISVWKLAEERVADSERRFGTVVKNLLDYAIFTLDPDGRVTGWWEGAELTTGYAKEDVIGNHFRMFYPPENAAVPNEELAIAQATGRYEGEGWRVRKDGAAFWVNEIITALRGPAGDITGYVKIARDMTERKRADEVVSQAKDTAETALQMRDNFLITLGHELRTPLSAILIWAKMIDSQAAEMSEEFAEGIQAIIRGAEAQKQLIDDLLDTSRIAAGKLRLNLQPFELAPVIREAIEAVRPTADAKGLVISTDLGADVGTVRADADRLRQVVWNLLTNAIKFTDADGRVSVGLSRRGSRVEIKVADSGRGIDRAFLPHVFEAFRQADASSSRTYGGLGLGLAICKQLVEQHGGTITAESAGLGLGATFVVQLPLPKMRKARPSHPAETAAAEKVLSPGVVPLHGVRILLVEDSIETQKALVGLLRGAGATVTSVESAADAFQSFQSSPPDILLSDIGLPGEDGYSLVRRVRAAQSTTGVPRIPALALTAFAREEDRAKALAAGFDQHLAKPVEPEQLVLILRSLVKTPGLQDEA